MTCAACQLAFLPGEERYESLSPYGTVHQQRVCIQRLRGMLDAVGRVAEERAGRIVDLMLELRQARERTG